MKSFSEYLNESKTIFDYLLFPPEGKELKIATRLSQLNSDKTEVYRGVSSTELKNLKRDGKVISKGRGNTRDIVGSYVSDDIQLASRFALRAWKDKKGGHVLIIDRKKLPDLNAADPGNYYTSYIPWDAVKKVIDL